MKVKELIEILKGVDPDLIVMLEDWNEDWKDPTKLTHVRDLGDKLILGVD